MSRSASITCLTCTAPGREPFLELCKDYVKRFDLQPEEHLIVNEGSLSDNLAYGMPRVKTQFVAFIEDDDWYHPGFLGSMMDDLAFSGRFAIGIDPTVYYHVVHGGYRVLPHTGRASMFTTVGSTAILAGCLSELKRNNVTTLIDLHMWAILWQIKGGVTTVNKLAIGIKHNLTDVEGHGHKLPANTWHPDPGNAQLKGWIGADDTRRYNQLVEGLSQGRSA